MCELLTIVDMIIGFYGLLHKCKNVIDIRLSDFSKLTKV